MADSFVQLPDDSPNSGKKVHTNTVTTGDGTVHNHVFEVGAPLPAGSNNIGSVDVNSTPGLTDTELRATPVPVSVASLPLPSGAATETTLATRLSESDFDTKTGSLTETAPTTDTASSGLNGRLQRIAQRLTSLIALLPSALVGGRLDINIGSWFGSTAPTVGQKAMANSLPVVVASDQSAVPVSAASLPLPSGAATETTLGTRLSESDFDTKTGSLTETAPSTDTASSGLNGRLQRIAQRITSLIALLPTALGSGGGLKVDGSGTALPVSVASLPLPSGAATETTLGTRLSESDFDTKIGSLTETAPSTDTASSGLNGRLQRIAQRITSLIALLPSALVGGRFDVNIGSWLGSTVPTVGQKTMANSVPVVVSSDQTVIPVSQSTAAAGTAGWPVISGNIARATQPWTSVSGLNSTFTITVTNYSVCLITVTTPGTLSGGGFIFEASDDGGSQFYSIAATRVDTATVETSTTLTASLARAWVIPCSGFTTIRVRLNPVITGAGSTVVGLLATSLAQSVQNIAVASLPLPAGASTETTLGTRLSESDFDTKVGSLTETAPASDTASSGLNGRLQRIAQRITSLIALLPSALVGGRFDVNLGSWLGSTAPTVGQKTMANSVPVTIASDQVEQVVGTVAHDAADSGNPVKVGGKAVDLGSTPTAVTIGDRTDWLFARTGIPFVLPGHPDVRALEYQFGTAAATDFKMLDVSTGTRIVVVGYSVMVSAACTVNPGCRIGFGDASGDTTLDAIGTSAGTPTATQMVMSHPAIAPGSGVVQGPGGILSIGGDGCDLFATVGASTGGKVNVIVWYFTVAAG